MRLQLSKARPRRLDCRPIRVKRQVAASSQLLDRSFEAPLPTAKWIADFTYMDSGAGSMWPPSVDLSPAACCWSDERTIRQLVTDAW